MSLSDHHVFHWFTTPEELRAIAAEMEEMWPKCSPGQDKTVRVFAGRSAELRVLVDQENITTPGWFETRQAQRNAAEQVPKPKETTAPGESQYR